MGKQLTYEEVKKLFEERNYELLETVYKNSKTKMQYRCPLHPDKETSININNLKSGYGCPYCAGKIITYEEAIEEFEKRGYELLEKRYINIKTKMRYKCPEHPNKETKITLGDLKQGYGCKYCYNDKTKKRMTKHTLEAAKEIFKKSGYELLETEYQNNYTPMRYRCPKHPEKIMKTRLSDIKNGHGCNYCGREEAHSKTRLSFESVKAEFEKRGYELLETDYKNDSTKMKYRCPKHPEKDTRIRFNSLRDGKGCRYCQYEYLSEISKGENGNNWKGGLSSLNTFLRDKTKQWKYECFNKYNGRCFITNNKGRDLQVHHPIPFHKLRNLALEAARLEIRENISLYTSEELERIEIEFKKIHNQYEGVLMKKKIHDLFHKIYGDNVTMEHIYDFKIRYNSGEFKQTMAVKVNEQLNLFA
ncbi:hypothetical protein CN514_07600 [Bacillus sp. AFS001701]|uniref:DUF723 domain-containing protein n=1 Tax=Bacillus sp. AFS001701 TaxID=2033480 RepID=UPI000BF25D8A|nr:DUF723 domain-containing protein [Bacillus sp. AFS001701]PET71253.1 hypothetical protein CN514_07600 [Bacillus sp. AFS001701]